MRADSRSNRRCVACSCWRELSLDNLLLAVLRDYDQLYGSAGPRTAGAVTSENVWMERDPIREHRADVLLRVCVGPVLFVSQVKGLWPAVAIIALATAAHQGWSCNMFTLASDMFPRHAIAPVVGIRGFGGAVAGLCISWLVSRLLQWTLRYAGV